MVNETFLLKYLEISDFKSNLCDIKMILLKTGVT